MARFLRRQVTYALRPPVAFPPAATPLAPPVQTHLSLAPRPPRARTRLSAPAVVAPAITFRPPLLRLTPGPRTRTRSQLRAPAVVGPAFAPLGPKSRPATQPRQARQSHYLLRPPATLAQATPPFFAQAPHTVYATATSRAAQRPFATSALFPPEVIDPAPVVVVFVAPPERLNFRIAVRRATEQHVVTSTLFGPEVVSTPSLARAPASKLAPSPRQGRTSHFKLSPPATLAPAVVLPPFRPLQTLYATATSRAVQRHQQVKRLSAPTVVDPAASGDNPVGSVFDPNYFLILHA